MAIAFDAATSQEQTGASTISWSHTCTGSERFLFVSVGGEAFNQTWSATYNGVAMTEYADVIIATFWGHAVYGLVNPASGANTVAVTASGGFDRVWGLASSYTGVDQTTPTGTANSASGTSTAPSVAISSASGDTVVDSVFTRDTTSLTVDGSQTQRQNQASSTSNGLSEEVASGASTTMSWTTGASNNWHITGIALKPSGGGGGAATRGTPFGHRGTAFNGGRTFNGIINRTGLWLPQTNALHLATTRIFASVSRRSFSSRRALSTLRVGQRLIMLPALCLPAK